MSSKPTVFVFSGDNRTFSYDQGTDRLNLNAVIGLTDAKIKDPHPAEKNNRWGTTFAYDPFDCQPVRNKPFGGGKSGTLLSNRLSQKH